MCADRLSVIASSSPVTVTAAKVPSPAANVMVRARPNRPGSPLTTAPISEDSSSGSATTAAMPAMTA